MHRRGILVESQTSISQFVSTQPWYLIESQLLHVRHIVNTFSVSVVTSLLARETVFSSNGVQSVFKVKLEVSMGTAVTVKWQTA